MTLIAKNCLSRLLSCCAVPLARVLQPCEFAGKDRNSTLDESLVLVSHAELASLSLYDESDSEYVEL